MFVFFQQGGQSTGDIREFWPPNLELERKLNISFDISLDVEGLFGAPFYFLADWKLQFHSIFFSVICGGKKPRYFHRGVFYIQ